MLRKLMFLMAFTIVVSPALAIPASAQDEPALVAFDEPILLASASPDATESSTWGRIKALYDESGTTTGEEGNEEFGPPISADELNAMACEQAAAERATSGDGELMTADSWQLYVSVPFYSQNDYHWSGDFLGYSTQWRIRDSGCHLSCISMMYARWGYYDMNPRNLNNWAKGAGAFGRPEDRSAFINANIALDRYGQRNCRGITPDQIYGELQRGHPVVIRTNWHSSHYVIIFAFDGYRYWVKDPWYDWRSQDQWLTGSLLEGPWVYGE